MPEVEIRIGGRSFQVACQEGEEHFLHSAAKLLDNEAQTLSEALGRVPEARMLLMAGLMLADKTAGLEEELQACERRLAESEANVEPVAPPPPERVEVIPEGLAEGLAGLAERAEEAADLAERKLAG